MGETNQAAGATVAGATADPKKDKIVEFRFNCTFGLRERVNDRLKELSLERADVMVDFLEEWLKETDKLIADRAAMAAQAGSGFEPRI